MSSNNALISADNVQCKYRQRSSIWSREGSWSLWQSVSDSSITAFCHIYSERGTYTHQWMYRLLTKKLAAFKPGVEEVSAFALDRFYNDSMGHRSNINWYSSKLWRTDSLPAYLGSL
jgi:hypothetical protein